MRKYGVLLIILLIVVIVLGIKQTYKERSATPASESATQGGELPPATIRTVKITSSGFDPATITINRGETVKWINESGTMATVNSDPHPQNNLHIFLNLGEIPSGYSADALFEDGGTFKYHNDKIPTQRGTVVVK